MINYKNILTSADIMQNFSWERYQKSASIKSLKKDK